MLDASCLDRKSPDIEASMRSMMKKLGDAPGLPAGLSRAGTETPSATDTDSVSDQRSFRSQSESDMVRLLLLP